MKIDHYSFGRIIVGGTTYNSDVIIFPDRVNSSWWRKEGHVLHVEDLADVVKEQPEVLIVGTGNAGVMNVPEKTLKYLQSQGIQVKVHRTEEAVRLFNELQGKKKAIAALHLTC